MGGFAIKCYGKLDHLVATGGKMGNGTGEALLAVILQHRGGSADRVPDDTTKQGFLNYLVQAADMAAVLRTVLKVWEEGTRGKTPFPVDEIRRVLGPLAEWHKLTGEREPSPPTEYNGPWGIWIAERDGWYTDGNAVIVEFTSQAQAFEFLRCEPLHLSSHLHHGESLTPRPLFSGYGPEVNAAGHKRIGYMVVNAQGFCVHGDDDSDPVAKALGIPSYAVLTGRAYDQAEAIISGYPETAYNIAPVYEGDIEEPQFYSTL